MEVQTRCAAAHPAPGKVLRLPGILLLWTAAERRRRRIKVLSGAVQEAPRQEAQAVAAIKACHLRGAVVAVLEVEAAAAADNRP